MKIILLLSCFISFSAVVVGQNLKINQAEKYFSQFRYADATPIYQELIQKDQIKIETFEKIYRHALVSADKSRDYVFGNDVLARLYANPTATFDDAFAYFQMSLFLGFTEKAKEILTSPIVVNSTDARKSILESYKGGSVLESFKIDTSIYKVKKSGFNSGKGDFNPIYHPKGIAFTSSRDLALRKSAFDNSSYLNLYLFSTDSSITEIKFLETAKHDGTAAYDSTNQIWYYSKNLKSMKAGNITTTGLFMYDEKAKVEAPFTFNTPHNFFAQPSLSEDGQTLWFASDKEGGFGKSDIWYSKKTEQGWSEPVNAGAGVNTSENEMFPFYQKKNLYFSSNGHAGLGGLDLFSVVYEGGAISLLKNMGANLNSNADDFSLVLDNTEKNGYFSSNREAFVDNIYSVVITILNFVFEGTLASNGMDKTQFQNIPIVVKNGDNVVATLYADANGKFEFTGDKESAYTFEINDPQFTPLKESFSTIGKTESDTTYKTFELTSKFIDVVSTIFDDKTNLPLANAKIDFINKTTGEIVSYVSDKNGVVNAKLLRDSDFEIVAKKDGYDIRKTIISTRSKEKEMKAPIAMKKLTVASLDAPVFAVGSKLKVTGLRYDLNKYDLNKLAMGELDKVAALLLANPHMKITFSSYTDSRGSGEYNMNLSKKRTEISVKYLVSKGVNKDNVSGLWYGETELVNECSDGVKCTDDQHRENRRTEIKVVSIEE